MTEQAPTLGEREELDVPATVWCSVCGRADCAGCETPELIDISPTNIWEQEGEFTLSALFRFAERTALEPEKIFGSADLGRLASAFRFACLCEGVALLSVGVLVSVPLLFLVPHFLTVLGGSLRFWGALLLVWTGATTGMVFIHLLWGASLEWGVRSIGIATDHRRAAQFGLYACGWDLLTSPAGIVHGLLARQRGAKWAAVFAAMRAPRRGLDAYLVERRGLGPAARKRAILASMVVFGGASLLALWVFLAALATWVKSALG